ncbi:DUF503 domain-containing protein [Venenivibrio stagnispumantis]|uniref:DUF503 domain-containing protein n=1 Tax=Venenivibrio stagnispumantis TaxID=407998 RepID=A0AA46ADN9_9AQUI|nr:DUF503 domain-containing protein [Venenivibrio stagnispumantis]MCW4573051.1 DUF503 domain-containing protein [Venenivibrio stagnispumantis]SMP07281.1 hypothetical protein SAMN06264868_10517 [Venenivibrio stagnispumantis]
MVIGNILLDIFISDAGSLKEKRMVIKSLKEKLRNRFNVSVAEVGSHDLWQSSQIAVVFVTNDRKEADKTFQFITNFLDENFPDLHINIHKEIY